MNFIFIHKGSITKYIAVKGGGGGFEMVENHCYSGWRYIKSRWNLSGYLQSLRYIFLAWRISIDTGATVHGVAESDTTE